MKVMQLCLLLGIGSVVQGQGRQIKMYLEQITANKVYIEYLQKGYTLVKNGLDVLNTIKSGHFSIDELFFFGLVAINPRIREYPRVGDIVLMTVKIRASGKKMLSGMDQSGFFPSGQMGYARRVFDGLMVDCTALLNDLELLLTQGKLQLSDDERIRRIDKVHAEVCDRLLFMNAWSQETSRLILLNQQRERDVRVMEKITGIK